MLPSGTLIDVLPLRSCDLYLGPSWCSFLIGPLVLLWPHEVKQTTMRKCEVKGQWSPGDQCQCSEQRQCVYGMWETPRTCPITLASEKCGVMSEESNASAYVRCLTRYLCQSSQPKGASRLWKRLLRVSLTRVVKIAPYYSLKSLVLVTVWLTVGCNTHGLEVCCRDLCKRCCWYLGTEC